MFPTSPWRGRFAAIDPIWDAAKAEVAALNAELDARGGYDDALEERIRDLEELIGHFSACEDLMRALEDFEDEI